MIFQEPMISLNRLHHRRAIDGGPPGSPPNEPFRGREKAIEMLQKVEIPAPRSAFRNIPSAQRRDAATGDDCGGASVQA